ncbi:MAG: FAD:protein FMN transferase [Chlamydiia bacterium]|nr:FAD:protein FMN transferase [Chlamydiia bacterium]
MQALLIFLFLLVGCAQEKPPVISTFSGEAMTMQYRIQVGHPLSATQGDEIQQVIEETFAEVHNLFNRFNPESEISRFNKGSDSIALSPLQLRLLTLTDEVNHATEGRFDPTIFPLYLVWTDALRDGRLPEDASLQSALDTVGWDKITLKDNLLSKSHPKTALDLGGISKGFAIDLIVERLTEKGYQNLFVEWGGEIRAQGMHPAGRDWKIYIPELDHPETPAAYLLLRNQAIATSGDMYQNWRAIDGKKYCHIIDTETLKPLEIGPQKIGSVSVIAPTCALADGLATALMTCKNALQAKELAERFKARYPEIDTWITVRPADLPKSLPEP